MRFYIISRVLHVSTRRYSFENVFHIPLVDGQFDKEGKKKKNKKPKRKSFLSFFLLPLKTD